MHHDYWEIYKINHADEYARQEECRRLELRDDYLAKLIAGAVILGGSFGIMIGSIMILIKIIKFAWYF